MIRQDLTIRLARQMSLDLAREHFGRSYIVTLLTPNYDSFCIFIKEGFEFYFNKSKFYSSDAEYRTLVIYNCGATHPYILFRIHSVYCRFLFIQQRSINKNELLHLSCATTRPYPPKPIFLYGGGGKFPDPIGDRE